MSTSGRTAAAATRVFGAARAFVLAACAVGLLTWAAGAPNAELHAVTAGHDDFDSLLPIAAGLLAWVAIAWFAVLLVLEFASWCPWRARRLCAAAANRMAPQAARAGARWILGVALVAGPLLSTSATAATPSGPPHLDRPVAAASPSPAPTRPAGPSLGLDLDRPAFGYLPPAPPAAVKTAPAGSLLATAPRREVVDDGYVVRRGDTLWDVAARHLGSDATAADIAREWPRWYAANHAEIGPDPGLLHPGQVLHAPSR